MNAKPQHLQDPFLKALRREHVPVASCLVDGIGLQGRIGSFDVHVVPLKNVMPQMVYKQAVSPV